MSQIFISYRRADEMGAVGRIHDYLSKAEHFGEGGTFMDVEGIAPGEDFYQRIAHQMNQSDVVLAMIGPRWLETIPARADDPADFVRIEIELAFERRLHVVPILLGHGLAMPAKASLPPSIARLASLNAVEIDPGKDFNPGMQRLIRGLQKLRETRVQPRDFRNRHAISLLGIRPGRFLMGATPGTDPEAAETEGPEQEVEIRHGFWMGKHAVTVEEYGRVMGRQKLAEILDRIPVGLDHRFAHHRQPLKPITQIDWHEARAFCGRLTELEESEDPGMPPGYIYRLPTEAEWEFVCRAGSDRQPRYGPLEQIAWTADSGGRFANVGEREANAWGAHDMLGLVHEWCCGDDGEDASFCAIRGGSYHEPASYARASARLLVPVSRRSSRVGMRLVLALEHPLG